MPSGSVLVRRWSCMNILSAWRMKEWLYHNTFTLGAADAPVEKTICLALDPERLPGAHLSGRHPPPFSVYTKYGRT